MYEEYESTPLPLITTQDLLEDDEISVQEAAFLEGYEHTE